MLLLLVMAPMAREPPVNCACPVPVTPVLAKAAPIGASTPTTVAIATTVASWPMRRQGGGPRHADVMFFSMSLPSC